jgi:hypothetical protein
MAADTRGPPPLASGPQVGARGAPQQSPILRLGREDSTSGRHLSKTAWQASVAPRSEVAPQGRTRSRFSRPAVSRSATSPERISANRSRPRSGGSIWPNCGGSDRADLDNAASEAEKTATLFRKDIQALYAIDRDAKMQAEEGKLSHEEHLALRLELQRERAARILLRIYRRARKLRKEKRFSDAGNMDNALKYVVNQRAA